LDDLNLPLSVGLEYTAVFSLRKNTQLYGDLPEKYKKGVVQNCTDTWRVTENNYATWGLLGLNRLRSSLLVAVIRGH
jgi:hypothetical protein